MTNLTDDSNKDFNEFAQVENVKVEKVFTDVDKIPERKTETRNPVQADINGRLVGNNLEEQFRLARAFVASGMLPKAYNTPEKALTAMQFAAELRLKPLLAMRQIAVINGTPSLFGDLPLGVVRSSGLLDYIREYLIDAKGERIDFRKNPNTEWVAAVCELKRKGQEAREFVYSIADAQKARIWGQNVWNVHPKRMAQLRARNWLLKDEFSDVLGGAAIAEYDFNVSPEGGESIEVEHQRVDAATNINEMFGGRENPVASARDVP